MTKKELSQLLMIGIPADGDLTAVSDLQPGGVILMGRNAGKPAEVRRLTQKIREVCATAPLIAVDQEGGRVQRLTDGFTTIPAMRDLAKQGARAVSLMAMTVAAELRDVGISCNFAPVCDVPAHADDTVIGSRAFSDDAITAALMAAEYIRGAGTTVLTCAKHFPGHGGVGVDSHHALPTFSGTLADLQSKHLPPFRSAMAAGVGAVMVGHIAVPALDASGTPASLSRPVVTDLLRTELNYRGLVVTDDLEMRALGERTPGEIGVGALAAGCDLLLFCHSPEKAAEVLDAIDSALKSGHLTEARVRDSLQRIEWAKKKYGVIAELK